MKRSGREHGMGKEDEGDKAQRSRWVNLGSMAELLFLFLLLVDRECQFVFLSLLFLERERERDSEMQRREIKKANAELLVSWLVG